MEINLENETAIGLAGLLGVELRAVDLPDRLPADLRSVGFSPGFGAASTGRLCALTEMTGPSRLWGRFRDGPLVAQGANAW